MFPVSDWPIIIIIGLGGLILVVSHPFAVLILWMVLEKSKQLNLDVRNIFGGSHTKDCWGCSQGHNTRSMLRMFLRIHF
jgi:hypothetical protein